MDILAQTALFVAITSFSLGFSVLARNVRNKLFIAFCVLCGVITVWALFFFFEKVWENDQFYPWHLFFNVWLGPAALVFMRVLSRTTLRSQDRFSLRLLALSILLSVGLSLSLISGAKNIPWVLVLIYFSPGIIALQTVFQLVADQRERLERRARGIARERRSISGVSARGGLIYFGALVVLAFSSMDHVPWMGKIIPSVGNVLLCAYLFLLSQAITQQRLLNIRALLSRFLVILLVAFLLTGVYLLLVVWIENNPAAVFLNSFAISVLVVMLLDPLRRLVAFLTQKLLPQEQRRLDQTLRESYRALAGIVDEGAFFEALLSVTREALSPGRCAIFVMRESGTRFRRARFWDGRMPGSPVQEVLADHPLVKYCAELRSWGELPVVLDQILENEIERSASRVQREKLQALLQALKALGANMLIPLFDGNRVLAFLTLWVPAPPAHWGGTWGLLPNLYSFFEQVAQNLRSLEVFVRQREKERLAALGEMAAGLAHEIRNPLGAIKGAAQFLDPKVERPESKFLQVIVEEVDRLNHVVTQFLDYSKSLPVEFRPMDASFLAGRTVDVFRAGLRPEIFLEFVPASAPAWVAAVPEQMQQVVMNLIRNSVKALEGRPSGHVQVSVVISGEESERQEDRKVTIAVEDDGHGITPENMQKLFIPFFTTSPSGTGLGLPISQKIVEAHQGRIEVSSEAGRFARFSVILPLLNNDHGTGGV